VGGDASGRVQR